MAAKRIKAGYIVLLAGVATAVIIAMGLTMRGIFSQITSLKAEKAELQKELEVQQNNTRKAQEHLAYVQTDGYVEKAARERLGWIRDGEKRIVAVTRESEG